MTTHSGTNLAPEVKKISRREMLYYLMGGSVAVLVVGTYAAIRYADQQIPYGPKDGVFPVDLSLIPSVGAEPVPLKAAHCWLVNIDNGLEALSAYCPHDGILVNWIRTNNRYECPACGAKFQRDGLYIEGPSPRNMDRYRLLVKLSNSPFAETRETGMDGAPISSLGAYSITVDTRGIIPGGPRGRQTF